MPCRGVLFALSEREVRRLLSFETDDERLAYLRDELEEDFFTRGESLLVGTGEVWDSLRRGTRGGAGSSAAASHPLRNLVLGGEDLYSSDDYLMILRPPDQVKDMAWALEHIDERRLLDHYLAIDDEGAQPDEPATAAWRWFRDVKTFLRRAAGAGRYLLVTLEG